MYLWIFLCISILFLGILVTPSVQVSMRNIIPSCVNGYLNDEHFRHLPNIDTSLEHFSCQPRASVHSNGPSSLDGLCWTDGKLTSCS